MIINEIKYGFTFNKGNYESERVDIAASPDQGETPYEILELLKGIVHGKPVEVKPKPTPKAKEVVKEEVKPVVEEDAKDAVEVDLAAVKRKQGRRTKEVTAIVEKAAEEASNARVKEENDKVVAMAEAKAAAKQGDPKPKKLRTAGTPYNRDLDLHKRLIATFLDAEFKTWKTNVPKAKAASIAVNGTEFLSEEGTILESFKEAFRAQMA